MNRMQLENNYWRLKLIDEMYKRIGDKNDAEDEAKLLEPFIEKEIEKARIEGAIEELNNMHKILEKFNRYSAMEEGADEEDAKQYCLGVFEARVQITRKIKELKEKLKKLKK